MQQIKMINDSTRFRVTSCSRNYVQGVRLRDGRTVTFCRKNGKIVKNCLIKQDNKAQNRALLKKVGFVLLLVLLFVSCSTSKNSDFKNVNVTQVKNVNSVQVYTVKKGDNLSKVFGYKRGLQVCAQNALKNCDLIFPNQKLKF